MYTVSFCLKGGDIVRRSMLDASAALWSYAITSIASICVIFCRLWWVLHIRMCLPSFLCVCAVCVCTVLYIFLCMHCAMKRCQEEAWDIGVDTDLLSSCVNIALYVQCHAVEDSCDIQHHGHWPLWSTKTVNEIWYIHALVQFTQRGITVNVSTAPNLTSFLL